MAKEPKTAPAPNRSEATARTAEATATMTVASGPTETGSVTYQRLSPDDPPAIETMGKTFVEGQAVEITDPRQYAKLKANPYFGGETPQRAPGAVDLALADALSSTSEEVTKLRAEANAANADLSAAERAQQTMAAIAEAQTSSDRDPPLTNHARNAP